MDAAEVGATPVLTALGPQGLDHEDDDGLSALDYCPRGVRTVVTETEKRLAKSVSL